MKKEKTMNENENENVGMPEQPVEVPADPQPQAAPAASPIPPEPVKPAGGLKILWIALAAVAVVAAAFFGIRAAAANKPLNKTINGVKKAIEAVEKADAVAMAENVSNAGSISVSVDLSKFADLIGMDVPATINMTGYSDAKAGKAAFVLEGLLKNKTILSGTLTGSEEQFAIACEALFGKTNYSLNLKNLAKNLPGSFLDPDTDSAYALPEELYNWLLGFKNGPIAPSKELSKQGEAVAKAALKVLSDSLNKNAEIAKASETISIGAKDVKTTAVTVKLNGDQAAAVATDLLKWAKTDKDLKKLLTSFIDTYGPAMEAEEEINPDEFLEDFYDGIDDALDEVGEIEKEDVDLTCVFYINNSNSQLVKAEITNKDDFGKTVYTFEGGPDWKDPAYISISTKDSYSKASLTYTVEENTKSQYTGKLKVKEDNETTMTLTVSWDKSSGDLRISSTDLDLKLTGTLTQKGKVTTIKLKKLEYDGLTIKDLGTTIELNEKAKMPSISKTTDILTLDEDGFEALCEDVGEAVQELMEDIQDAME